MIDLRARMPALLASTELRRSARRLGWSFATSVLVGAPWVPASTVTPGQAQTVDLRGGNLQVTNFGAPQLNNPNEITNGSLTVNPDSQSRDVPTVYNGILSDRLGQLRLAALGSQFGFLRLNGNNSYSGGTDLTSVGLIVGNNMALGTGPVQLRGIGPVSAVQIIAATDLVLANAFVSGGTDTRFGVTAPIFDTQSFTVTLNGVVSGQQINKQGSGTLILNGTNTHSAGTAIIQGTVQIANDSALGNGTLFIGNGTTLVGAANAGRSANAENVVVTNAITTTGAGTIGTATGLTLITANGGISGSGSLVKTGNGLLVLNSTNSYSGGTSLNGGTIRVGNSAAFGTGAVTAAARTMVQAGVSGVNLATNFTLNGEMLVDNHGIGLALSGVISGSGGLTAIDTIARTHVLTLSGVNSYSGGTVIDGTTVAVSRNENLGAAAGGLTLIGGTLRSTVSFATDRAIQLGSGGGTLSVGQGTTLTSNGVISGGALTVTGGELVLNGTNTHTGGTIIRGATVTVSRNENLGAAAGGLTLESNSVLRTTASFTTNRAISLVRTSSVTSDPDGTLLIANGTSLTLDGVISGGSLSVNGGFLFLNGANTHAGGTTVSGGTIVIANNAALGSGSLTLNGGALRTTASLNSSRAILLGTGGGMLSISAGTTLTSLGIIAGTLLTVEGGELVLNGTGTYTGGTRLNFGTITVGNDRALGTGALAMAADTTLNVATNLGRPNNTDNVVLANDINISGRTATGTSLPGTNTASLTITGTGVLVLGGLGSAPGATTAGAATINTGAGLTLFLNGVVSGDGRINKTGAGQLVLAGQNSFAGGVTVAAGTLNVTGALASGVTVASGALLVGTGRIGSLLVQTGGSVNPGGAGTADMVNLAVAGAVTLAGTYTANIAPTANDSITAGGAVTLGGTLAVVPAPGTPLIQFNQSFTLASGTSLTGTFATVTGLEGSAFTPVMTYTATGASLRLAPQSMEVLGNGIGGVRGASVDGLGGRPGGLSGNALEVARAFDRAVAAGYNPQSFFTVYSSSGSALQVTLRQMSGEQRAAERRVVLESGRVVRESALDRLNAGVASFGGEQVSSRDGDRVLTFWLRGAGAWGTAQASGAATGFTTDQRGVLTGIDWAKDGLTIGGMFHFTRTDIDYRELAGSSTVETVGGTVYGGYRRDGGVVVNGGISIAGARTSGSRAITLAGFAQSLPGPTTGSSYQFFGEAAYDLAASADRRIEPFARVAHVRADMGSLSETGGVAALAAAKQGHDITVINLGGRVGANIAGGKAALNAGASWQGTSGDRDAATVIGIPALGQNGLIRTVQIDRSALSLQADAAVNLSPAIRLSLGYSGLIGQRNSDHGGRATLMVAF